MLEKSDVNVATVLSVFNSVPVDVSLLVPTETGHVKSIMDATAQVREFLAARQFHHYGSQPQGPAHKVIKKAFFVTESSLIETQVSLYRPLTKTGDPRIWFAGLKRYANPHNLLALLVYEGGLYVVNCSLPGLLATMSRDETPLAKLLASMSPGDENAVAELLQMMRVIHKEGFVRTHRAGDTGIGKTLENLLGVAENSRKTPDYKGIEIKSKRVRSNRATTRSSLFGQTPAWHLSPIRSAWQLLSTYGYRNEANRLQLYHEINARSPNSLGFVLEVDAELEWLKQIYVDQRSRTRRHLTTWEMAVLHARLLEKHPKTFWVEADCRGAGADEEFHFVRVVHTRSPIIRNFDALLESGQISVDYTLSAAQEERQTVRDHGYNFKIHPRHRNALFPPPTFYELAVG